MCEVLGERRGDAGREHDGQRDAKLPVISTTLAIAVSGACVAAAKTPPMATTP